jgi:hypothetical protein
MAVERGLTGPAEAKTCLVGDTDGDSDRMEQREIRGAGRSRACAVGKRGMPPLPKVRGGR